ncbi:hypothetical protein NUW54_g4384 [Trametes sanguinea]|uniref:Uncharacterized protein n=1 Tax=Trametes sanguinea TaxID=158606 RepID=A0ACC1PY77_9APHY|nr:hypothetical protein NUW54_g4384 [Trametes sanguinea]
MSNGSLPSLSDTYGALLIGTFFGCILFGLTIRQGYLYFLNYAEDSKALKILVLWVLSVFSQLRDFATVINYAPRLLEMFTSVLSIHACYYFLVSSFSNPIALILNVWSLNVSALQDPLFSFGEAILIKSAPAVPTGIGGYHDIGPKVRTDYTELLHSANQSLPLISYFARRVWIIGVRYRIAVAVALALCMAELAFMAAATIESFINIAWVQFIPHTWLVPTGSSCAVVADFILTVVLVYVLRQSRTGIKWSVHSVQFVHGGALGDPGFQHRLNARRHDTVHSEHRTLDSSSQPRMFITGQPLQDDGVVISADREEAQQAFILPGALYYAGVGIPGNRTYAICLLAALNARKSLKERGRLTTTALFRPSESTGASLGRRPQACSRTLARQVSLQLRYLSTWADPHGPRSRKALSHPSVRFDNTGVELQHVSTTSCSVVDIKGAL